MWIKISSVSEEIMKISSHSKKTFLLLYGENFLGWRENFSSPL